MSNRTIAARLIPALSFLFLLLAAGDAAAQRADSLRAGARIRVRQTPTGVWKIGRLAEPVSDSVRYRRCAYCYTYSVPVTDQTRLEVSRGRRRTEGRVFAGMLIGAVAGTAIGAITGSVVERDCDEYCGIAPAVLGALGFTVGFPIGLIAGLARVDDWVPVPLP